MVDPAHKELDIDAFVRVAHEAAMRQDGVAGMIASGIAEKLGVRKANGVSARVDEDGWLHLDISIVAMQAEDLLSLGARVQEAVISAVRETSDQPMGPVNVHVAQRGNAQKTDAVLKQEGAD
jgi:uncharacterized alkaline shock family protein YloU